MREFRVGHDGGGIRIDQHHLVSFGTQRLARLDRKSTRLNSSHSQISYAVFCLKKKKPELSANDMIELLIHIFHDNRNAFYFSLNPLGVLAARLIIDKWQLNRYLDYIWYVRCQK